MGAVQDDLPPDDLSRIVPPAAAPSPEPDPRTEKERKRREKSQRSLIQRPDRLSSRRGSLCWFAGWRF